MTDELPPIEFLDAAAKASGFEGWHNLFGPKGYPPYHSTAMSAIAHARTLQRLAKYEPKPVDPAELQRRQDAREASGTVFARDGSDQRARAIRDGEYDGAYSVQSAYIALCHRDGTTPIPVDEWGEGE